jgi:branched-chain amino acid transport system permease protein
LPAVQRPLRIAIVASATALLLAYAIGLLITRKPLPFAALLLGPPTLAVGLSRLAPGTRLIASVREAFRASPRASRVSLVVALLVFPFVFTGVLKNPYWVYVATIAAVYVCLALGLNVVVGLAGLLDLGYVAFYAIGAYSSALVSLAFPDTWWALWAWVPCSVLLAAGLGVLLGFPTLRLRGDYLAIVTLGFGEIIRIVLNNWDSVTNGPKGLASIPSPRLFSLRLADGLPFVDRLVGVRVWPKEVSYYLLTVGYALLIAVIAHRLDRSPLGRAWRAIREDELAAKAMGVPTVRVKLLAFAIGASFAGIAGLIFAHLQTFIDPNSFVFMESAIILCMVVLGGMGNRAGVVVGAVLLAVLPEKLRDLQDYRMLAFGVLLVIMMILRPQGLLPRAAASGR